MEQTISLRSECIKFLRKKGTKAAVQVGHEGPYVFVEKNDIISQVLTDNTGHYPTLTDYSGDTEEAFVHDNVLHFPVGVN